MPSTNPIHYFRQQTGRLLIKPSGATNPIDMGQVSAVSYQSQTPSAVDVVESEKGFKRVSRQLVGQIMHSYELTVNETTPELIELINLGSASVDDVQASIAAPAGTASFTGVGLRQVFDLGKRDVVTVVVKNQANTVTYVENTDYTLDAGAGQIKLKSGGAIADGATINVTFGCNALTRSKVEALKKVYTSGDITLLFFDQHSEIPIEEHTFTGQYKVTDRGTDDGTKIREVRLTLIASTNPIVKYRK